MNNLDGRLNELLEKIFAGKKGVFNSKFIFKRLKLKNKDLIDILSVWINQMIIQDKVNLINTGKDKNNDSLFMTIDCFIEKLKQRLLNFDYNLDENMTYSFLCEISEAKNPNIDLLIKKIQSLTKPLVKFDKGSRDVPIMFNLFRVFIPERMINISDQMIETIDFAKSEDSLEYTQTKKMVVSGRKNNQKTYSTSSIILTALSYLLIEKGKLILTKEEIENSRGYKVFFNSPDFNSFLDMLKKTYPFNPFIEKGLISFYPENWLDLKQIKKQIKLEKSEEFLQQNFPFLDEEEISTLKQFFIPTPKSMKKDAVEKNNQRNSQKTVLAENSTNKKINNENVLQIEKNHHIIQEKPYKEKQEKKKIQKSEPLTFLNEIISKETQNNKSTDNELKSAIGSKKKFSKPEELIKNLDKTEKHYLLCILDSTKIKSGYYTHSRNDESFQYFINKLSHTSFFKILKGEKNFIIKRKLPHTDRQYEKLRESLEDSIMNVQKYSKHKIDSKTDANEASVNTVNENDYANISDTSILDDLFLNKSQRADNKKDQKTDYTIKENLQETFGIESTDSTVTNDINIEDTNPEQSFEVTGENSKSYQNEKPKKPNDKVSTFFKEKSLDQSENSKTKITNDLKKVTVENVLNGKIISVLTDDQVKWLKIKMLSKQMGFDLRDSLAYKPEIAVFDEGFSHLEPIAKNTGAIIMPIEKFLERLGLREKS